MICWSCEKDAGGGALCVSCGAPQPVSTHGVRADHFAVLGVERRYDLDAGELEARYKELSLPPVKIHCSVLAEDAIKSAIADYKKKRESRTS